jgi:two-component system chemotaxis response regulator CheB
MPGRDVIVMGASAGGVEALTRLVATLPSDLPAAIALTLHLSRGSSSNLPSILSSRGPLKARFARDGDRPKKGQILVARPDHHLVFEDGSMRLTRDPHENGHRPAIDALFRSAAWYFGRASSA